MASEFFFRENDQEIGPLSLGELVDMVCENRVTHGTLVRKDDNPEWFRAERVVGLFGQAKLREKLANAGNTQVEDAPEPVSKTDAKNRQSRRQSAPPASTSTESTEVSAKKWWSTINFEVSKRVAAVLIALTFIVTSWLGSGWLSNRSMRFPPSALKDHALRPEVPTIPGLKDNVAQLVPGLEDFNPCITPTLTDDLKTIVFSGIGDSKKRLELFIANRHDVTQPFESPRLIVSCSSPGDDVDATLSPDGLELIFCRREEKAELYYSKRASRSAKFGRPTVFQNHQKHGAEYRLNTPQFIDQNTLLFSKSDDGRQKRMTFMLTRNSPNEAFGEPSLVEFGDPWALCFAGRSQIRAYLGWRGLFLCTRLTTSEGFTPPRGLVDMKVTGQIYGTVWVSPKEDVVFFCSPGPGSDGANKNLYFMQF